MSDTVYPPESVYNLIPKDEVHFGKPPRYISKYRPTVILENKSTKDVMRTMGPAKVEVPCPDKFLKKHSKEPKLPEKEDCLREVRSCTQRKPPVPCRTDNPLMGIHTKRDFTKPVVVLPKKPQPAFVDTQKGHKQILENSGLIPKYIKKKQYGEVPVYLQQRAEEERRAQQEYDDFRREQREQTAMKRLTDDERQAVLEGLKKRWDEVHHEFQGLSLVTDTTRKKMHRQRLEAAMKQLENDINVYERSKTIYIPNNLIQ